MGVIWNHSNAVEFDANGDPAAGALAYFYSGGTTTPLVVYSDAGESTPITTPVTADANGRWPNVFIPYIATYDVRVTTSGSTQLYYPQLIPNANPATVGTGTILTSSSQLFQTGGMRFEILVGSAPTGWVRANGLTIGSATSGATERANADTVDLYTYLYNAAADGILPVTGGRLGGSAAADFAANRPIMVPDLRGGVPRGVDTMGNSAAGRFGAIVPFSTGSTAAGASLCGLNGHILTTAQLATHLHGVGTLANGNQSANHTHAGTSTIQSANHTHGGTTGDESNTHTHLYGSSGIAVTSGSGVTPIGAGSVNTTSANDGGHTHGFTTGNQSADHTHTISTGIESTFHTHTISGSTANNGTGDSHNNTSSSVLGTWLIKL